MITSIEGLVTAQTITFNFSFQSAIVIGNPIRIVIIDDVKGLVIKPTGTGLTDPIDLGGVPTSLNPIELFAALNGGNITLKTQSSVLVGGPYSPLLAVDGANVPQSPLRRFWKIEPTGRYRSTGTKHPPRSSPRRWGC